jgi:hypothetical protein
MKILSQTSSYRYLFQTAKSPTYFLLAKHLQAQGWQARSWPFKAHLSERHFDFEPAAAEQLEAKHLLAQLMQHSQWLPETYAINDVNWPRVLHAIADKYYRQGALDSLDEVTWILKPSLLNNGQNIKLFKELSAIEAHYLSSQRLGGEHVLQRYLSQPALLRGHKYSMRMFVVLSQQQGAYLYPQGYLNVALEPYQANDFSSLSPHLTNEHLNDEAGANVVQIPSHRLAYFPLFYQQIQCIVKDTILALQAQYPKLFHHKNPAAFALFGFDFMADVHNRVWLLEANHGPCFPIQAEHPLQAPLYDGFWSAFIQDFVEPMLGKASSDNAAFDPLLICSPKPHQ